MGTDVTSRRAARLSGNAAPIWWDLEGAVWQDAVISVITDQTKPSRHSPKAGTEPGCRRTASDPILPHGLLKLRTCTIERGLGPSSLLLGLGPKMELVLGAICTMRNMATT